MTTQGLFGGHIALAGRELEPFLRPSAGEDDAAAVVILVAQGVLGPCRAPECCRLDEGKRALIVLRNEGGARLGVEGGGGWFGGLAGAAGQAQNAGDDQGGAGPRKRATIGTSSC